MKRKCSIFIGHEKLEQVDDDADCTIDIPKTWKKNYVAIHLCEKVTTLQWILKCDYQRCGLAVSICGFKS